MRVLAWSVAILVLVFICGLIMEQAVEGMLHNLSQTLDSVTSMINAGEWDAAQADAAKALRDWEKIQTFGSVLFHNQPLDNVSHALHLLNNELSGRNRPDSLRAVRNAASLITLLQGSDDLSPGNLF